MRLSDVEFPIYVLHTDEVEKRDGILWCEGAVVDDTNAPGTTIGQRRLNTAHKNLYDLRHMIDSFVALSKHRGKFFVDSNGNVFVAEDDNHRVTKWVPGSNEGIIVAGGNGKGNGLEKVEYPCLTSNITRINSVIHFTQNTVYIRVNQSQTELYWGC